METNTPLAELLRPKSLDTFVGQHHLVGKGKILRNLIESDNVPSIILWGPPGSGKTTLARIIASQTNANFKMLSATLSGVSDIRKIVEEAQKTLLNLNEKTILFIDEIHRFNKAQQDTFLPHVEKGEIILIGATTENPSFEVNNALLSRCRVLVLKPLSPTDLELIVSRGLENLNKKDNKQVTLSEDALEFLVQMSNADARTALNVLEITFTAHKNEGVLSVDRIQTAFQKEHLQYDRTGEEHYNTISAFIKSMRAGDSDATIYYLARMIAGGEDPKFIARRMVIFASEDIGVAQPTALVVANAVFKACEVIGYPECQINLAHGAVYLAKQAKDRTAYDGLKKAMSDVEQYGNLSIPLHIRNAPTQLMKDLGYGKNQNVDNNQSQSNLPPELKNRKYL